MSLTPQQVNVQTAEKLTAAADQLARDSQTAIDTHLDAINKQLDTVQEACSAMTEAVEWSELTGIDEQLLNRIVTACKSAILDVEDADEDAVLLQQLLTEDVPGVWLLTGRYLEAGTQGPLIAHIVDKFQSEIDNAVAKLRKAASLIMEADA